MPRIKILPEILSNKIAAGEVVERPASVIKELVENALDAGSTKIIIEVEGGGRSLIRVSDNGIGMSPDDALLSLERYATSKIYDDPDLFAIRTLGFRGEALPSIASISRFTLTTRDKDSDAGTDIQVEGGKIKKVAAAGVPVGTMITVRHLFFNTPARRKFLKAVNTEMGHIAETVAAIALGAPGVQFKLIHNNKIVKNWPLAEDPFDRVVAVMGRDARGHFRAVTGSTPGAEISGWISTPDLTRSTSQKIYLYVNGRYIRDRGLQHALFEGYRGRLMKGRFPLAVLSIRVPAEQLDVNVHPTKHEVRFSGYRLVYDTLKQSVFNAWDGASSDRQATPTRYPKASSAVPGLSQPDHQPEPRQISPSARETHGRLDTGRTPDPEAPDAATRVAEQPAVFPEPSSVREPAPPPAQAQLWSPETAPQLRVVGQVHNTYIVCESDDGMVLIDQHAAHERIYYEQLQLRSSGRTTPSQRLLVPETLDLGYKEAAILDQLIPDLLGLGLEVEPFGGQTYVIKAAPAVIAGQELKPLLEEILEKTADIGFSTGIEKVLDECRIVMACHGAVRARHRLSGLEMTALIDQLGRCENPSQCPHGRPIQINWPRAVLEKFFKRIG